MNPDTKGLQCFATICSCLKYYGRVMIGVARKQDRDIIYDMVSAGTIAISVVLLFIATVALRLRCELFHKRYFEGSIWSGCRWLSRPTYPSTCLPSVRYSYDGKTAASCLQTPPYIASLTLIERISSNLTVWSFLQLVIHTRKETGLCLKYAGHI